jgi:catechol 2,3-dioxygenase-like lactoylglutathione lyase family enzyme
MKKLFQFFILTFFFLNVSAQTADTAKSSLNITVVCLLVNDYDKAVDFYTQKLGFQIVTDVKYGSDQRWVTLKLPSNPAFELSLGLATTDEDKMVVGRQGGRYPFFVLASDDFNNTYNTYKANGVEFPGEPKRGPGGLGVTFKDLYGNVIYLRAK